MRRAGFREVRRWPGECEYGWDAKGYLGFLTEFDEQSLFDDLEPDERAEIEARDPGAARRAFAGRADAPAADRLRDGPRPA